MSSGLLTGEQLTCATEEDLTQAIPEQLSQQNCITCEQSVDTFKEQYATNHRFHSVNC